MSNSLTVEALSELIMKAGHSHHEAYMEAQGIDPDWAMWYSGFIQAGLFGKVEQIPPRSALVHMLVQADIDHPNMGGPDVWAPVYAADMLPRITGV